MPGHGTYRKVRPMDRNPTFKHAYDPMGESGNSPNVIKCPKCGNTNFTAFSNAYGVHRTCRNCKNEWSGGGVGVFPDGVIPPPATNPVEDDDYPISQFTGGPHRRFGGDDE